MNKKNLLHDGERLDDLQYKNLFIIQHPKKYCFTSDAVMLANFVKGGSKDKMVDLCSGSGVIGILASQKQNIKSTVLVELQEYLADMSNRSIEYNQLQDKIIVVNRKLQGVSKEIGEGKFSIVVCNPPYKLSGSILNENSEIAICRHEIAVTLEDIIKETSKLLKYGGKFYTVNKEERLVDIACLCRKYGMEVKKIEIIPSEKGANVVMVEALKGGKSGVKIDITPRI